MYFDHRSLKIFIDSSPANNPVPGGIVGWLEFPAEWAKPPEELFKDGLPVEATGDKKALVACSQAFRHVYEKEYDRELRRILLITDSTYIHANFFRSEVWARNGWRTEERREIEHKVFWQGFLWIRRKVALHTDLEWAFGKKSPFSGSGAKGETTEAASETDAPDNPAAHACLGHILSCSTARSVPPYDGERSPQLARVYREPRCVREFYKVSFALYDYTSYKFDRSYFAIAPPEVAAKLKAGRMYTLTFTADPVCPVISDAEDRGRARA